MCYFYLQKPEQNCQVEEILLTWIQACPTTILKFVCHDK